MVVCDWPDSRLCFANSLEFKKFKVSASQCCQFCFGFLPVNGCENIASRSRRMAFSTYFEAKISPPKRRESLGADEPPVLILRPFESTPKLIFKNVLVGQRASKQLLVRNPHDEAIRVELVKCPAPETGLTFSCKSMQLNAHQGGVLEVIWQPLKEGKSIYCVNLKTNTNSRFSLSIVCVGIQKKATKRKNIVQKAGNTPNTSKNITQRSFTGQISRRKNESAIQKSACAQVEKTRLRTFTASSCASQWKKGSDSTVQSTMAPVLSKSSSSAEIKDHIPNVQDELFPEEDLTNVSSETYIVCSPQQIFDMKECAAQSLHSNQCTSTGFVRSESNIFSNFTLSPLPMSSFQPRSKVSRETYSLLGRSSLLCPEPLSPDRSHVVCNDAYVPDTEDISQDSLLASSPALNQKKQDSTFDLSILKNCSYKFPVHDGSGGYDKPLSSIPEVFKSEVALDFNFSPVQESHVVQHDISGISDISEVEELKNRFSNDVSTLDISLPPFTPLQVKKFALSSDAFSNKRSMEDETNVKNKPLSQRNKIPALEFSEEPLNNIESIYPSTYMTFSPPQVLHGALKENRFPQRTNTASTAKSCVKQSDKKDSSVRNKKNIKKQIHYPITKLLLRPKKLINTEESVLMNTEKFLKEKTNPSYFMSATLGNPFINGHVFYDEQWFDEREKEFVKWLNVLLTPPEQLSSSDEMPKVDGAELWKKWCKSDVAPAPSCEVVSSLYLVNHRLDSVRRKACAMFRFPAVADVLSKVTVQIEKGILSFRKDTNIRDIGLMRTALELLLCYNPLWLRIGLETIMGRTIPLQSNSDVIGIASFITQNILSDPYLTQRYAISGVRKMFRPGYEEAMKKHILKKFFFLVFFLDYAKNNKLIFHNPCLFCKDAQYKESREVLLAVAREFLSGIGDVTKHLRTLGYVVKHKQTYLNEYNYAVTHLGSDLRDGVRLVKVTEIILQDPSLSLSVRVPAISKLQKIHNVKIALTALTKAGNIVEGEITAKDIVEGHKEKTMSLIWQIINKFQVSRFTAAANMIQKWYRSLHIFINRKIQMRKQLAKQREMEDKASIIIQKYWRRYIACKKYKLLKRLNNDKKLHVAAIATIQSWIKATLLMQKQQKLYQNMRNAAILIQCRFRAIKAMKKQRKLYLQQRSAAILIQQKHRAVLLSRKEQVLRKEVAAARRIQCWFRCSLETKKQRTQYLQLCSSVVRIQRRFRAVKLMKQQRMLYLQQRSAAILIQQKYRAVLLSRKEQVLRKEVAAARRIQCWFRCSLETKKQRTQYLQLCSSVVRIQRRFRAMKLMKQQRMLYLQQRSAAILIQQKYRAVLLLRKEQVLRKEVAAARRIQCWFRCSLETKKQRTQYLQLCSSVVRIQCRFRAVKLMKQQRMLYLQQRSAAILIQQKYRAVLLRRKEQILIKEAAARTIQCWFRCSLLTREQRMQYLRLRSSVVRIQRRFRAVKLMKQQRMLYLQQRSAVILIQQKYRAVLLRRKEEIIIKEAAARTIQCWFRCSLLTREQRMQYLRLRSSVVSIQRRFRAVKLMKQQRMLYLQQRSAVILIQQKYRAVLLRRKEEIIIKEAAARTIQCWFRCSLLTREQRMQYLRLRSSVVRIQRRFRAVKLMKQQRMLYLQQRSAVILIQQKYRAVLLRRKEPFLIKEAAARTIQCWIRCSLLTREQRMQYLRLRSSVVRIQRRFRAVKLMKQQRMLYLQLRSAAILIQQKYRGVLLRRKKCTPGKEILAARKIQAYWRGYKTRMKLKASKLCCNTKPANTYTLNEGFSLRSLYHQGEKSFTSSGMYATIHGAALLIEGGVRLSPELCEEFLLSPHLDTLLVLLETMNRSEPAERLLFTLVKILINILRHPSGVQVVLMKKQTIPVMLTLTNIWCAKRHEVLFCYFCTAWWLIGENPIAVQEIRKTCDATKLLVKCYTKVKTWNTPRKSETTQKNLLPTLLPSWSLHKTDNPKFFLNANFAITQVLNKLNIHYVK